MLAALALRGKIQENAEEILHLRLCRMIEVKRIQMRGRCNNRLPARTPEIVQCACVDLLTLVTGAQSMAGGLMYGGGQAGNCGGGTAN